MQSGEVLAWDEDKARHHVLYDDGEDEWLDLGAERLVWHKPGCRPAVAAGLPEGALPSGSCTGRQRRLLSIATDMYKCQYISAFQLQTRWQAGSCQARSPAAYLLPRRVSNEPVEIGSELCAVGDQGPHRQDSMVYIAMAGTGQPCGRDAVGWRVGVYWRDDHVFYPGIVDDVHRPTGHHIILYDDGAPHAHLLWTGLHWHLIRLCSHKFHMPLHGKPNILVLHCFSS